MTPLSLFLSLSLSLSLSVLLLLLHMSDTNSKGVDTNDADDKISSLNGHERTNVCNANNSPETFVNELLVRSDGRFMKGRP